MLEPSMFEITTTPPNKALQWVECLLHEHLAAECYVYLVPYVESEDENCLKTIIPSRKFTKIYLGDDV
jgi:hypothetical protein